MNYILIDFSNHRKALLPFTFTRPISEIRIGILSISEKWKQHLNEEISYKTEDYLQEKFPYRKAELNTFINSTVLPTPSLIQQIKKLNSGEVLMHDENVLAYVSKDATDVNVLNKIAFQGEEVIQIKQVWDIFAKNHQAIEADFNLLTKGRTSAAIPDAVFTVNPERIFVEEGAKLYNGSLNASEGPIYIGKDTEIMENCSVRGPFALCEHSTLKMGAKIYTGTTIGPHCKVGGEVSNSVIFGYSNKGHDGFLGNSVIGEWCNIGADTNTSNLKNNYAPVRLWNYETGRFAVTGLQFCGLMMGDHSKCGINTMFNTGTVVGVNANIFGAGFPRNFIPSYSWGGSQGTMTYKTTKAFEVAEVVMKRRNLEFTEVDKAILEEVFEITSEFRRS
jgi:UDP-N-acetylglucosamine diphosphorylase/glucosamine-1-phosphate N-acetyltransferase